MVFLCWCVGGTLCSFVLRTVAGRTYHTGRPLLVRYASVGTALTVPWSFVRLVAHITTATLLPVRVLLLRVLVNGTTAVHGYYKIQRHCRKEHIVRFFFNDRSVLDIVLPTSANIPNTKTATSAANQYCLDIDQSINFTSILIFYCLVWHT